MAGGVGYAEGYLGALSQISGIKDQQQQTKMRGLQIQQQQQEMQDNQQEKSLLSQVFKAKANDMQTGSMADKQDRLAQTYQQAGQRLMGVNPQDGLKLMQEGDRMMHQNAQSRLELARAEKLKGEYLATMASGVEDQSSLDEYVQRAAKEGQVLPQKYQVWNEATKSYLERAVQSAIPIAKQQDLALRSRKLELDKAAEDRRQQDEERKVRLDSTRETRLREGLELKKAAAGSKATSELGLRGEKAIEGEINILKDTDTGGVFKTATPGLQRSAAQDVHYRAQKIRADSLIGGEEPVSAEEALTLAREQVLGEFKVKKGEGVFEKDTAERQKGGVEKKASGVLEMPKSKMELVNDKVYQTARGPAVWKYDHFESVE